jgi:hypothetical protein
MLMVVSTTPVLAVGVVEVACTGGELTGELVISGGAVVTEAGAVFREKVQPAVKDSPITSRARRQMYESDRMMFNY